ncbi:MAG: ATP-dependent DNA helicase PcrA [Dehalococcoidaceae bacterium]|nr:ATP-dependent DNA helicase PcrA [Dehalococcoidaceae bacterium]
MFKYCRLIKEKKYMSKEIIQLNTTQRKAVEHENGQLIILAGPGSGKTRVITSKIAHLILNKNLHPRQILAATFTKKAATEMKERIEVLINQQTNELNIGTFHSICALLLRKYGNAIGIKRSFTIYDGDDQRALMRMIINDMNLNSQMFNPNKILNRISKNKNDKLTYNYAESNQGTSYERRIYEIAHSYQQHLQGSNALDFDDLLIYTYQLLLNNPESREQISQQFKHVLIDEFQDTNTLQYEISKLLASAHNNITIVGDPDQSIYSWRSANIANITKFQEDFPKHELILLEQNYRSTKSILEVANNVIATSNERIQKEIWTENITGDPVELNHFNNGDDEGNYIANTIKDLLRSQQNTSQDIAVMYRTNAQSRIIEEALLLQNIKYRIVGGLRFYERKEIKDLLAYLRIITNPNDTIAFTRIINTPTRGIGKETLTRLLLLADSAKEPVIDTIRQLIDANSAESIAKQEPEWKLRSATLQGLHEFLYIYDEINETIKKQSIESTLSQIMQLTKYEKTVINKDAKTAEQQHAKRENINELLSIANQYDEANADNPVTEFLHDLSLIADVADVVEDTENAVTLTTLHSAKGLEFPIVFLPGVEEGLLPHVMSLDTLEEIEEERRILYVGITRAKNKLYISTARSRYISGSPRSSKPSRFLSFLENEDSTTHIVDSTSQSRENFIQERKSLIYRKQLAPYAEGMKVRHDSFGDGLIVSIEARGDDQELTVAFKEQGIKKILASHAPMEQRES